MKLWKQLVLSTYYHGTSPYRSWRNRRAERDGRAPIMILTFHRIDDDQANDWTTSYAEFVRQIDDGCSKAITGLQGIANNLAQNTEDLGDTLEDFLTKVREPAPTG